LIGTIYAARAQYGLDFAACFVPSGLGIINVTLVA
jgi:hypothetical protein